MHSDDRRMRKTRESARLFQKSFPGPVPVFPHGRRFWHNLRPLHPRCDRGRQEFLDGHGSSQFQVPSSVCDSEASLAQNALELVMVELIAGGEMKHLILNIC